MNSKINFDLDSFRYMDCSSTHDTLEKIAYRKWEEAGRPDGRSVEFWCEAEREMYGYTAVEGQEMMFLCFEEYEQECRDRMNKQAEIFSYCEATQSVKISSPTVTRSM